MLTFGLRPTVQRRPTWGRGDVRGLPTSCRGCVVFGVDNCRRVRPYSDATAEAPLGAEAAMVFGFRTRKDAHRRGPEGAEAARVFGFRTLADVRSVLDSRFRFG